MGACSIYVTSEGNSMSEAFRNAQKEAEYEYGHDPYNGAINNCSLKRDITTLYNEASNKRDFIEQWTELADKREVYGIHLGKNKYLFFGYAPE